MSKNSVTVKLHRPSVNEKLFFLISGAIVSVPLTLFVEQFADPFISGLSTINITIITLTIFAPFIEEFSKIFPLFYRHGETERSIFSLALFVGLGFGIVEFFTYFSSFGPQVVPFRLPLIFFHPASASIAAYGIATKRPVPYYLAAVSLHFINNFIAILDPRISLSTAITVLAIALYSSWQLHKKTKEKFITYPDSCQTE